MTKLFPRLLHSFRNFAKNMTRIITPKREEDATLTYKTDDWEGEDYDMHLLTFKSDDIERTHAHLKAQGVSVSEIKLYDGNRKNFRFYDLNGNRLDVWSGWL